METSSTALALLQWGIIATVHHTTPVSTLPSHQTLQANAWNAILRKQPESRNLNRDTAFEVTLRSSHSRTPHTSQDWNSVLSPPKKLYPPLGHYAINVYTACPEKASVLQLFINFLLYSRRGKIQLSKMAFQNSYTGKKFYYSYSRAEQASNSNPNGWVTFFFL